MENCDDVGIERSYENMFGSEKLSISFSDSDYRIISGFLVNLNIGVPSIFLNLKTPVF